ncbi:NAD(+) synthase, partial [bacterium]|nr:NAD(+) synthase [bacterium]
SFQEVQVTSAVVDLQRSRGEQAKQHGAPCFVGFEGEKCGIHTVSPGERFRFSPPSSAVRARSPSLYWEQGITDESREFEEFSRAASLGLFDYLRKSRSRGYVVSLSGGCDSTAVVVLARMAILRAFRELGADEFRERLAFFSIPEGGEPEVLSALLTTVWQGTENNSPETLRAAQEVARVVGSRHHESDIDPWVALYRKELEGALGRSLSYEADGLVLQNLQARVRAPLPWGLANAEGKLLLTTSNRSEAAFGYCTMDGDTAGGLNPIGGVGKHFLRQWLRWCETTSFREELGVSALPLPLPQLHLVNALAPSAELLPPTSGQADEKELGPYALAARIEECYFREGRSPSEILELLQREFSDSKEDLRQWITNFFESFARSQWKRERLAPSFHLDSVNLDPRTWCRWPILSGGFQEELREISQEQKEDGDEHE